jgi:hypothetical protein
MRPTVKPSPSLPATPEDSPTHPKFKAFNHHGRIDYSIEEDFFANEYVAALTSHFYWEDENFAIFLAHEISEK